MNEPIDLGQKNEFLDGPGPVESYKETYYPEFTYTGEEELDLPEEGTMTIKYCVKREVSEHRGEKERYTCTIGVKEILSVKAEKDERPSKRDMSAEDALDTIAKSLSKSKNSEETY